MKKEEAMVALPQKQKHTNHLLKIAYISGFCNKYACYYSSSIWWITS